MSLSPEQFRRVLRHVAVLNRWRRLEPHARELFTEWDAAFTVKHRGLTYAELARLLVEHREALKTIMIEAYGSEIVAAKEYLQFIGIVLDKK